jgi:hypothetical protein
MRKHAYAAPLTAVGLISAAALAYEILLTRLFAIIHWHHLVAAAISLALLGYGASGTFLAIAGKRLQGHFAPVFIANALLFSLSALACVGLAQRLPFDPQALTWDPTQLVYLTATFLILAIPFFAAANCIGLSLWTFQKQIPRLYGFDLIGAGLGSVLLLVGLTSMSPADNLFGVFIAGILVAIVAAITLRWHPAWITIAGLFILALAWFGGRPDLQPAAYKDLSRSLAVTGATVEHSASGVAGTLSVVRNDRVPIRTAPGLSLHATALPPRQLAVFVDGDNAGTLHASNTGDRSSAYLKDLISALPYQLLDAPRVVVLNAGAGLGVEQALSLGAASVNAIEPNPQLQELSCGRYRQLNSERCGSRVNWQTQSARAFIAGPHDGFDLITLAVHADASGLDALKINFDLTREAIVSYLGRLTPGGLIAIEGPTRLPPRLSLRTIATASAALKQLGISEPGRHLAAIRGWQRFLLLVSRKPLDTVREDEIRAFAGSRGFDLIWLPNMKEAEANRYQRLNKPQYYLQAGAILDPEQGASDTDPRYRLRPASDDMPFPNRFTSWTEGWSALRHGDQGALSQLDTGLLVAAATLSVVTAGGILLIILPLLWPGRTIRPRVPTGQGLRTLLYFVLIGVGFLFIEIAWIQRLQLFLGLPVYATTAVLVTFLVFAGLGSLWSQNRSSERAHRVLLSAVFAILLASLVYLLYMPTWLNAAAGLPLWTRGALVLVLLAPLAFAMGIPFPTGLRGLGHSSPQLIPWAWGINGCASVISAASAPLLAMEIGFNGLIAIAVIAYLLLPLIRIDRETALS